MPENNAVPKECCVRKAIESKEKTLTSISNSTAMSHSMFSFLFCQLFSNYRPWNISFKRKFKLSRKPGRTEGRRNLFLLHPAPQCQRNTLIYHPLTTQLQPSLQLTLKQWGFELSRSIYMQIFLKYTPSLQNPWSVESADREPCI